MIQSDCHKKKHMRQRDGGCRKERVVCMYLACDFCQEIPAEGLGCTTGSSSSSSKEYIK